MSKVTIHERLEKSAEFRIRRQMAVNSDTERRKIRYVTEKEDLM